ncbi:MAG: insulinase family protein [Lachnospiraceae bacterium]|nr:insulinase family protein [Lachnospiraceae bacterium]
MNLITNNKKIISVIVAIVVSASFPCDISAEETAASGSDYRTISTYDFETFGADVHVYEHVKTGANVVFIHNDDPNKYFMLEFDTPTRDNRGLPHVFEHSAMCGSKKYPSRSLTRALYNRSYLTYGNALTRDKCTIFPIASLSEEQLIKFADYYSDLCFEPSIITDEDIFRSEAWRFSLEDENDDLAINGTIYSEMTGNYTADRAAIRNAIGLLYPGSASSFESGGIPSEILKLSYEDVKAFHERYYHPSNCTAYLYGDIKNEQAFLDLLAGYFGRYGKKDIDVTVGRRRPEEGFVGRVYDFPAAEGTDPSGNTEMVYAVDLGDPSDKELQELYAFVGCCNTYPGTVTMILRSEFPGARFDFNIEQDQNGALLYVTAGGMNEEDADRLRDTIEKIFVMLADSGLDEDELEDYRFKVQTDTALARESQTAALSLLSNISNLNSCGRGRLFYMNMRDRMRNMSWFDNDLVKDIASGIVSSKRSAMSIVVLKAGLAEENEAQLAKLLSEKKKSMTAEEKKKLVSSTKRITEKAADDPSKYLDEIRVVNASNLPAVGSDHTIVDKTDESGTRRIWVSTDVDAVNATTMYLDASSISQDKLGYLALFTDLVNGHFVPTGKHSSSELFDMISDSMYREEDISLDVSSNGNAYDPYVVVSFMCDPGRQQKAFDLTYEMLFDSRFEDTEMIRKGAAAIKSTIQNNIERNPESLI